MAFVRNKGTGRADQDSFWLTLSLPFEERETLCRELHPLNDKRHMDRAINLRLIFILHSPFLFIF